MALEAFLVRILFPAVFVQVLVEVLLQLLVFFGQVERQRDFN